MVKYISISFVIIYLILFLDCSGRKRDNPLDPLGNSKSPVKLYLYPDGKHIKLEWEVSDLKDYKGFRIYRSMGDTTNFQLLNEVNSQIHSYTDSSVNFYHWYYYRVSVLGYQIESSPSKIRKTLPGPGVIDILSRYGYSIHEYSYDLLHTIHLYNTEFPPINWDWDQYNGQVWLAYAQYRSISKLNLTLGYEDFIYEDHFLRPVDVKWDQSNQLLYILDSQKAKIYSLFQQMLSDSIELPKDDFFKMLLTPNKNIVAIDSDKVNVYSVQGSSIATIQLPEAFIGQDLLFDDGYLYILAANIVENRSLIMKFELNTSNSEEIFFNGYFEILARIPGAYYFWGSEFVDLNNYHLVKLSETGQRLFELTTSSEFSDMQINQIDRSLVTVQRYLNRIALYDSSGSLISENFDIYDPVKALIR
jgi:hypothetical protein